MPLSETQRAFAVSREPFPCFCGGFGSGKTAAAIARAMALKAHFKTCDIAYYLPTYPLVEDIAFLRFPELCERKGWAYKLNKASKVIEFPGAGRIVFRTMENPARIVGYEVAHSILDELDTLPIEKARDVWNKVIARNRQKCAMGNTVAVATTPEGFRFVYQRWVRNAARGYVLFRAKTIENAANLPSGYIENLRSSYPPQLIDAYLNGEFVNLASGVIYAHFDRKLNHTNEKIQPGEALHVGVDFNVLRMHAIVSVIRNGLPLTLAEMVNVRDTPALAKLLKERFMDIPVPHPVTIYPDASGQNTSSKNASESDLSLLRQAGFMLNVDHSNPAVKDRINAVSAMTLNADGLRRWLVNTDACPVLTEAQEQQAWGANGEPDKTTNHDHPNDAVGYFLCKRFPVIKRTAHVTELRI